MVTPKVIVEIVCRDAASFRRRVWLPPSRATPGMTGRPSRRGCTFHDLRHTHKAWVIEDEIPEVLQHKRLGHRLAACAASTST